ncbi:MAG: hypothetical protein OCU22_02360 [Canidatus Methanoxibalbensis ujae]|nr:hypothetical protein [Candidatus Methanoxibalbensis ujae]
MELMKRISVLIVLAMVAITVAVFVSTVAAQEEEEDPFKIYGYITDANGNPLQGYEVIIKKQHNLLGKEVWRELKGWPGYMNITNESGYYSTGWCYPLLQGYGVPWDNYRMYINGELVDERYIGIKDWEMSGIFFWKYQWNYEIPEFTTIAVPIAAIFGLILLFNHRKHRI